jgi:hypothetical protein
MRVRYVVLLALLNPASACDREITAGSKPEPPPTISASLSVSHSPSSPSTTSTVTISAAVTGSTSYTSSVISVDGQVVKSCTSDSCTYGAVFPAGSHTYSAMATDNAGNTLNAGPKSFTVWQTTSGGPTSGSATSPHWSHARFAAFDYRIHYLKEPQKSQEYDQVAARYDVVIGGDVDPWKARNPAVQQYVYDLIKGEKFTPQNDVGPMETWLASNGYSVENAYLHKAGTSRTAANRVEFSSAWGSFWALNLGDPGQRAWRQHVTRQMTAQRSSGFRYDGLFYDVLGSGSGGIGEVPKTTLEYGNFDNYKTDLHTLLSQSATWMPSGRCMANTGNYLTAEDGAQADSCGAVLMEFSNNIYSSIGYNMWNFVGARLAAGTQVILVPQWQGYLKSTPRYDMNPGNYSTVAERVLLAEYANYLMLLDPARMDLLAVDFYLTGNANPSTPHDITWLKAFEVDIGVAVGARSVLKSGTDGAGQSYAAFQREFSNALVVYRPMRNWAHTTFGDITAEPIPLPSGHTWRLLLPDGSLTGPLTSVQLRNGEAAIFMKN